MVKKSDIKTVFVPPNQTPMRLDLFISQRIRNYSRSAAKRDISKGLVLLNGRTVKPSHRVHPGDEISLTTEKECKNSSPPSPQQIKLQLLYRDNELLIVNKPPLLLSHPTRHHPKGTLLNGLIALFDTGTNDPTIHLIHRLDKGTSGALLAALNKDMAALLSRDIQERKIKRTYLAYVWGKTSQAPFIVRANIGKDGQKWKAFSESNRGKPAETEFIPKAVYTIQLAEKTEYISVLECKLKTGRTHQIRLHAKFAGYPLVGDESYGDKILDQSLFLGPLSHLLKNKRAALHASQLTFTHPRSGELMTVRAPLPPDLQELEKFLESYGKIIIYPKS